MVEEKEAKSKKVEDSAKIMVVEQYPTQPTNKVVDEKGAEYTLITRDEALTEMLDILKQLKRGLL